MNILIIAYYYPPINSGGTMRPAQMGKYLARLGHRVTVLTQTYGQPHTEPGNPTVIRFRDISCNKHRVNFRRRLQWFSLRIVTEMLNRMGIYHSIYSWWKREVIKHSDFIIQQAQPDVIIATYPPVETLEVGVSLSQRFDIPLVSDFRDGLIFEPIETKRMNRYPCIRNKYLKIEQQALAQSSAVTSIAPPITDYYRQTYRPRWAEVISNAFDPDDPEQLPGDIPFDRHHFNIVFTGRFALSEENNCVDFFFEATRMLIEKNPALISTVRIHLVGEYRKNELMDLNDLIENGMIVVHGFVERQRALAFQKAADLLLIITLPDRRSSTSAKLFEYLYAGKPILSLTHNTVLEDIIRETGTGWNVHPQDAAAIADLMEKIICNPEFYHSLSPNWEQITQYSILTQIKKLDDLLQKTIK
ncbi:MAG: glycosyltransferase [Candidatus Omnitrophota bacterium]